MPNVGSGTMSPITGGRPGTSICATPIPHTLLSLSRYSRILGIPPLHFAGASTPGLDPQVMPVMSCGNVWAKYAWQRNDQISHMELAEEIRQAEYEIARVLKSWPAPMWIADEPHPYPRPFAREYSGLGVDVSGRRKAMSANFANIISGGRRGVTLIGTATTAGGSLVYTDDDGDGFFEHATITLPTALTDVREIKVYFTGHDGELEWEIRPVCNKYKSGGNIIIVLDSYLMIEPDLYEIFPTTDGYDAIDISDVTNFITSVDVYREYNDTTSASSQFIWENDLSSTCTSCGGVGCEDCTPATQDGCLTVRNYETGIVTPFPAEYNGGWLAASWTECREPDSVRIWYYGGLVANEYAQNRFYDPLSSNMAKAISYLATARLDRPLCGCDGVEAQVDYLQRDMALREPKGASYYLTPDTLSCPFGTKVGEVKAWRLISRLTNRRLGVALI